MGWLTKLNKLLDIGCKIFILIAALALALLPVPFLLGHEILHIQPYYAALDKYQSRAKELQMVSSQSVSNFFLNAAGSPSSMKETVELADFICYWFHEQGQPVVRKYLDPQPKKKKGPNYDQSIKTVNTLEEKLPLLDLKNEIGKYINFESDVLKNKRWVLISPTELDNPLVQEIEKILNQNPGYKFIVVSPIPLKHKIFTRTSEAEEKNNGGGGIVEKQLEKVEKVEETTEAKEGKEVEEVKVAKVGEVGQGGEGKKEEEEKNKGGKIGKKGKKEEKKEDANKKEKKVKVKKVKVELENNETREDL